MKEIVLIGAGGHARVVADIIQCMADVGEDVRVSGFLDDNAAIDRLPGSDIRSFGPIAAWRDFHKYEFIVAIGNTAIRVPIFKMLNENGARFATAVHPHAVVARDVRKRIGDGTIICAGVVVNTGASVGRNVILNTGCTVDHDCVVHDHAHVAPGAHLAGGVIVYEAACVYVGASIGPGCKIGNGAVIAAGAAVVRDIPAGAVVAGVPARPIRQSSVRSEQQSH